MSFGGSGTRASLTRHSTILTRPRHVRREQIDALCKDVAAPDLPALTFECNVTDGYSWLNLIMAATAMSPTGNVEGAPADVEVGDPAVALASNCNTLGTAADPTGCCTQTAPTESPWVEYDLGGSYEVRVI